MASSHLAEALNVLVLDTLERSGPLNGYRIATLLDRFVGTAGAPIDLPTLYSAILQQKQRGLLSASASSHEGRRVRTYEITPQGRRYLKTARVAWQQSASLLSGLVEEQGRQRREVELAQEVQTHFFPSLAPAAGLGLDIAGRYRPARDISGDYYDILRLSETSVAVVLGDVSGKGIAAALLMATLRAFVRSLPADPAQLSTLMCRLNHLLHENSPGNRFASLFYAVYDVRQEELVYVNAGHPPPVVFDVATGAAPARLIHGGPVLGLLPDSTYEMGHVPLAAGSVLVAYSDGLTEAFNPSRTDDWGEARLTSTIRSGRACSADALADHLLAEVTRFTGGGPQHDDMTLLVARREDA